MEFSSAMKRGYSQTAMGEPEKHIEPRGGGSMGRQAMARCES
jgi:hypothetical protein